MNFRILKNAVVVFVLTTLFFSHLPTLSVYADTDSNDPVSDLFKEGKNGSETEKPEGDKESDVKTEKPSSDPAVGSSAGDYIKTLFALLFVIGLLYGLLKFVNRKNRMYDKTRLMKNMGGLSLGQHKSIQLVQIGNSYYLIGVGEDIRLLKEITDPDEIEQLANFYAEDGSSGMPTAGMLNRLLQMISGSGKKESQQPEEGSTNFSNLFNTTLDEMKEERKKRINRLTEKERNRDE